MKSVRSIVINDLGTNVLSQTGAIAALKSKNQWIDHICDTTRNNQKIIKDVVDKVEGAFIPVYPSDSNWSCFCPLLGSITVLPSDG